MVAEVSGQQRMVYGEEVEGLGRIEAQGREADAAYPGVSCLPSRVERQSWEPDKSEGEAPR